MTIDFGILIIVDLFRGIIKYFFYFRIHEWSAALYC